MLQEPLSLLRSPLTLASLRGEPKDPLHLVDDSVGQSFPIRDGIAVFIGNVEGQNLRYQRLYDAFAPLYDFSQAIAYRFFGGERKVRMDLLAPLQIREGATVLEVSVGTGGNWRWLPESLDLFGVDISWGQLAQCKKNLARWNRKATLCQAEAEHLPFPDDAFDVVLHLGGINFFNDKRQAISEMIRVAKPGARLLIADETEDMARWGERVPGMKRFYRHRETISPSSLLPEGMQDVQLSYHLNHQLYALYFRKPERPC